jgi:hypothetical protein
MRLGGTAAFCVWEGFGSYDAHGVVYADDAVYIVDEIDHASLTRPDPDARPAVAPEPPRGRAMAHLPRVVVPNRAYWLFGWTVGRGRHVGHRSGMAGPVSAR